MWKQLRSRVQRVRLGSMPVVVFGRPVSYHRLILATSVCLGAIALVVVFSRSVVSPGPAGDPTHSVSSRQEVLDQHLEQRMVPDPEPQAAGPVRPVPGAVIVPFGWMYSPVHRDWRLHTGVDLAAGVGEPVVALAAGIVVGVSGEPGASIVTIEHPGLGEVTYGNVQTSGLSTGDRVAAGQVLGLVGDCRVCLDEVGSHLHLECRIDGKLVDVAPLLPDTDPN